MYLYPRIKDDPLQNLYKKIVSEENEILKELASQNDLTLIDTASLIEKSDENFVDAVHFYSKRYAAISTTHSRQDGYLNSNLLFQETF